LGYEVGRSLIIERRLFEPATDEVSAAAATLVSLPVDVLFAATTPATQAAQAATSTIPIVFVGVGDPIGPGIVASYAHPGGNTTGMSNMTRELTAKLLELLKTTVPGAIRVAVLWNPA